MFRRNGWLAVVAVSGLAAFGTGYGVGLDDEGQLPTFDGPLYERAWNRPALEDPAEFAGFEVGGAAGRATDREVPKVESFAIDVGPVVDRFWHEGEFNPGAEPAEMAAFEVTPTARGPALTNWSQFEGPLYDRAYNRFPYGHSATTP